MSFVSGLDKIVQVQRHGRYYPLLIIFIVLHCINSMRTLGL